MKKLFTLMLVAVFAITVSAQTPRKMSYQAVVRNPSGELIISQAVGMKISILQGSATGTVVYAETFNPNPQTNMNGLVTVEIGSGTPVTGTFTGINWAGGPYFLKTEIDPNGGTSYTITGTSQLLSVPYALYAGSAGNVFSGNYNDLTNKPLLFSGSYNDLTNKPSLFDGTWSSLTGKPAGFADGIDNIDDADNSITNEIQALSLSGTVLSLSNGGGSVTLPLSGGGDNWGTQMVVSDATLTGNGTTSAPLRIAQQGAAAGQILKWNGSLWAPADDATGGGGLTLPYSGTGTSGSPLFNIVNLGTSGAISTLSSGNYAIWGEAASPTGIGVHGINKTSTGVTFGVKGDVWSPTGYSGHFQGGRFYIEGNTGIGIPDPTAKLEVAGQVKITGGSPGAGKVLTSDGTGLASWQVPQSSPWLRNASNIYYNSGNVAIGLNNPAGALEIYCNSLDSYPQLLLSEADGYARATFRTMVSPTKHWVIAGHTNATDSESKFHINYNNGSVDNNIISVFGNSRISLNGNVGIGTNSPNFRLDIAGQINLNKGITEGQAIYVNGSQALWYNGNYFSWGYGGNWNYFADKVYIGPAATDPGANHLVVNGAAAKPGGGSWATWSDERLKDIHGVYSKGLDEIAKLQPVSFSYREENPVNLPDDEEYAGLVAQKVQEVFPEAVTRGADGYLQLDIHPVNIALINAVKELKAENGRLKSENEQISSRLSRLEKLLEQKGLD